MDELGYRTYIENETIKIVKGELIVMKVEKIPTNLYIFLRETLQEVDVSIVSSSFEEKSTML